MTLKPTRQGQWVTVREPERVFAVAKVEDSLGHPEGVSHTLVW